MMSLVVVVVVVVVGGFFIGAKLLNIFNVRRCVLLWCVLSKGWGRCHAGG
jgi:hypothetical protein